MYSCWKDNSKARVIAANNFPEVYFSANTKSQLALIKLKFYKITHYKGICNNGGAFSIAAHNFQKKIWFPNTKL